MSITFNAIAPSLYEFVRGDMFHVECTNLGADADDIGVAANLNVELY